MFLHFSLKDFIDILLVALMLYYIYRLMRQSRSINIFVGIMIFVLGWVFVSQIFEMRLLGGILDKLVSVGFIAIIVIFQEDIRKFLYGLGTHDRVRAIMRFISPKHGEQQEQAALKNAIMPIVMACLSMSKGKVGALIVVQRHTPLTDIISTGEMINADINQRLIENIFFKNSPLHDGAMVIADQHICAAGCILPVSHNLDIPKSLGLRHRAALGMSQESDALCIVVSEETGNISVAKGGQFRLRLSAEKLESVLTQEMI
jgi:uncharacterized protein (TIGR00159 family)